MFAEKIRYKFRCKGGFVYCEEWSERIKFFIVPIVRSSSILTKESTRLFSMPPADSVFLAGLSCWAILPKISGYTGVAPVLIATKPLYSSCIKESVSCSMR